MYGREMSDRSESLGTERISKLMFKFCVPCIMSLLVSALYNIVDQIFIGNSELSTLGNAATGVVFPVFVIAQAFAWGIGDGVAAFMNIRQGRSDTGKIHNCVGSGITVTFAASIVIMAVFFPVNRSALMLFGASDKTIGMALEYFNVILAFFPAYMLSNMINSVIRADGSPSWSMISTLSGAAVNLVLDPVFIFACKWGMAGAAWATVIGQSVSLAVCIVYLFRTKTFALKPKSFVPDMRVFWESFKLGASSFVTQMTIVAVALVGNMTLAKYGASSHYGSDIPIAVMSIESKVFTVVINIVVGIVLGSQPIIGYNVGAENVSRVKSLYKANLICAVAVGLISTVIFEAAPDAVAAIFGKPTNIPNTDDYWDFARKTFRIFLSLVSFTCIVKMSAIFFQAAGRPIFAVVTSLTRDILCFVPLICILPLFYGVEGVLIAAPVADAIAMALNIVFTAVFFKGIGAAGKNAAKTAREQ